VVVVADHTKIGKQALAFLCDLSAVDVLIVDSQLSAAQRQIIENSNAHVILAGEWNESGNSKGSPS
jgi:DeoR/GlpR family transcriptional regulator of sugar metabolism